MELKREQIIKALECCTLGDCYPCAYGNIGAGCIDKMCGDALALIKKLTEDVERVTKQCGEIIVECDERDAERLKQVAELTKENERLRAEGEWAKNGTIFKCTACSRCQPKKTRYCQNCGAKMKGERYAD